jgi:hypothetical protein
MGLLPNHFTDISITKEIYQELSEIYPEHETQYTVHFDDPDPISAIRAGGGFGVAVDRKTHKLLYVIKREGSYDIPEHLR